MKKVLIATKLDPVARDILNANGNYEVIQDESGDLPKIAARHPDAHALIVRSERVTEQVIAGFPRLKVIVRAGSGFNTIDTKYARSRNIDVMNTPGANSNAVAEEVIALMLSHARHVIAADASTRAGEWLKKSFMGREVAHKTIGIIGLGNIGRLVAKRLSGFDVKVLGHDPIISKERAAELDIDLVDLPTLCAQSDYITLHIPENDETRGLVGEALLSVMKEGTAIVNCARAGIIDEEALRRFKPLKKLAFLNDVYPKDAEGHKSVADIADIMLPHLGASTVEANANAARRAAEELIDLDEKGITSFIVNRDIPEGLDEAYCDLANTLARMCRCIVGRQVPLKLIETSFYGTLEPYADWLLVPIVAGICDDADRYMDYHAARAFLEDMGIDYVNRNADPRKGYESSITVDLTGELDADNLRQVSVRGTVAESTLMVARINQFNKLFFEPLGDSVMFMYDDRPGVIGKIGARLAEASINIEDMRNPHDPKTNRSLAILKVNQAVPDDVIESIKSEIDAQAAFSIRL